MQLTTETCHAPAVGLLGLFPSARCALALGDCRRMTYQIAQDFRSPSRSDGGSIAGLCDCRRDAEGGRKDQRDGMGFDKNRLKFPRFGGPFLGALTLAYPSVLAKRIRGLIRPASDPCRCSLRYQAA